MSHAAEMNRGDAELVGGYGPGVRLRLYWKALGFPKARNRYAITTNVPVRMSDGVRLQADLYRPAGKPNALTVLVRTPYSRGHATTFAARFFAAQGYNVLIQSVRGTSGSEGDFEPMTRERADGLDTVEWMRAQQWFDGRFVTYGQSYLAYTQWAIAQDAPAELQGMMLDVGPDDFAESIYGRGPMDLINFISWSNMMSRRNEPEPGLLKTLRMIRQDARTLRRLLMAAPLRHAVPASFDKHAAWFAEWLKHPDVTDEFWDGYRSPHALGNVRFPVMLEGGWADLFLRQTLHQWQVLHERGMDLQVRISNDTHTSIISKLFDGTYPRRCLAWIDGVEREAARVAKSPPYEVRVGGTKHEVRALEKWPPTSREHVLFLTRDGRIAPAPTDRALTHFTFDPTNPTPSVGGHTIANDAGFQLNNAVEQRDDVLVFTGERLETDLVVIGHPACALEIASTNPNFDLFVRLCDVDERGYSRNVTDEIARFNSKDASERSGFRAVSIMLQGTAHRFIKGHRVRVQVSGGAFPRYSVNKGGGAKGHGSSVTHTIQLGMSTATRLVLPVVEA
jgi:putative CocE/NonD family hydrolase